MKHDMGRADELRAMAHKLLEEADRLDPPPPPPDWLVKASKPVTPQSMREATEKWTRIYNRALEIGV